MARSPLSRPCVALVSLLAVVGGAWVAAGSAVAWKRQASGTVSQGDSAVTATWIGPYTGGLWSDAANWDTTEYPNNGNGGLTYDVVIEFFDSDARYNVINLDTDAEINSFVLRRAALEAQSGPADLTINGLFEWGGAPPGAWHHDGQRGHHQSIPICLGANRRRSHPRERRGRNLYRKHLHQRWCTA